MPATVWAQDTPQIDPYNRQNKKGYVFDGHTLDDVVVKPYDTSAPRQTISVAKTNTEGEYDDQTVFLYNPATGLFLSASGTWGTEAVGLYKGFGLPFNIVDPTGCPDLSDAHYDNGGEHHWSTSGKWGVGFYSDSSNEGHYLSRDGDKHAGEPVFKDSNNEDVNKIRFYTDRGWNDANERLHCAISGEWSWAENNHIFTWHLEKIDKGDDNLNVYRLCQYIRNYGRNQGTYNKEAATVDEFYKHYVKFEEIDPFGGNPFYALTTARTNKVKWSGGESADHEFVEPNNLINSDETPEQVDAYPDVLNYEWQIVTRKDLKEKFLLDFDDPFAAKVETGNATFNVENPDFSRPLKSTIGGSGSTWNDANTVYAYNGTAFDNGPYGRYAFLHPQQNGTVYQTLKPYQFGLFRVDVSGFVYKTVGSSQAAPTVSLSLNGTEGGITYTGGAEGVTLDEIYPEDGPKIFKRIGDIARQQLSNEWRYKNQDAYNKFIGLEVFKNSEANPNRNSTVTHGTEAIPGYSEVRHDTNDWDNLSTSNDLLSGNNITPANDWYVNNPCLYYINSVDRFGRRPQGVYIHGKQGLAYYQGSGDPVVLTEENTVCDDGISLNYVGPWEAYRLEGGTYYIRKIEYGYYQQRDGSDIHKWSDKDNFDGVITAKVGDKITLGPVISGNGAWGGVGTENYGNRWSDWGTRLKWWTPTGNYSAMRDFEINVDYDSAGDYICTFQSTNNLANGDNVWNVVRYRIIVESDDFKDLYGDAGTPEPSWLNVNNSGDSWFIDNATEYTDDTKPNFSFKLVEGNDHNWTNQEAYQNAIAATDEVYVDRAIGEFLYDEGNSAKYAKSLYFYLPEGSDATLHNVKVNLSVNGVTNPLLQCAAIDNVRLTYAGDTPYVLDEKNEINPNKSYATGNSRIPVYMNRKFIAGAWNAFVCPLPLNGTQVKAAFGDGVKISEIDGLGKDNNYRIVFKKTEFNDSTKNVIVPGRFYIVKPSGVEFEPTIAQINTTNLSVSEYSGDNYHFTYLGNHDLRLPKTDGTGKKIGDELAIPVKADGTIDSDNLGSYNPYTADGSRYKNNDYDVVLDALTTGVPETPYRAFSARFKDTKAVPSGSPTKNNDIVLHGSYLPQEISAADKPNSYVFATVDGQTNLYHLSDGGTYKLNGFRFYITDKNPEGTAKNLIVDFDGITDESEATEIINALVDDTTAAGDIYNLSGQKVSGKLSGGIYVKNGKKFLVK